MRVLRCAFLLLAQAIRCNLTLVPQPGRRDEAAALGRLRLAAALGIDFVNIANLPLRIAPLPLAHTFVSPRTLVAHISRHLALQARACEHACAPALLCADALDKFLVLRLIGWFLAGPETQKGS
jgi:hypothetical protein